MRTLAAWAFAGGLLVAAGPVLADTITIQIDPRADLARWHTFALRETTITSARPELDNRLFIKSTHASIRAALTGRGLREVPDQPDVFIDVSVAAEEITTSARSPARGVGPLPVRYTDTTLVIDVRRPGERAPLWRGIYRDEETTGSGLVRSLIEGARKMTARYPRVK